MKERAGKWAFSFSFSNGRSEMVLFFLSLFLHDRVCLFVYLFICCFLAVHNVVRLGYWMFTARMKWGLTHGW